MKEMTLAEIRQVQLSILDKVHAFCEENGITYYLAAGTLLGAIRHGGYIPWDDDIDLYVLRRDYDRLETIFNSNPPDNLCLLSLDTEKKYTYPFIKIEDVTTVLTENNNSFQCGVNIDVFPIDGVPDEEQELKTFYKKLGFYELLDGLKSSRVVKKRGILKNTILIIGKVFTPFVSLRTLSKRRHQFIRDTQYTSKNVGELSTFAFKIRFPRALFMETTDVLFEGKYYKAPKDWDLFLKLKFGDYMQLPPIEQRITHHSFKAYWKRDY